MPNRDFSAERQGEFVLKCKRVGVDGRGRLSRPCRFARIFAETLNVSHGHALRRRCGLPPARAGLPCSASVSASISPASPRSANTGEDQLSYVVMFFL